MSSELLHNYSGQHCDYTPRSIISRIAEIGNINGPSLAGSYKALPLAANDEDTTNCWSVRENIRTEHLSPAMRRVSKNNFPSGDERRDRRSVYRVGTNNRS